MPRARRRWFGDAFEKRFVVTRCEINHEVRGRPVVSFGSSRGLWINETRVRELGLCSDISEGAGKMNQINTVQWIIMFVEQVLTRCYYPNRL